MNNRFAIDSQDSEILLEFERFGNLNELAQALGKDISVVSRNLKRIAESGPFLEKRNGRWTLTTHGISLNNWTREAIHTQRLAINKQTNIKIGTTREFANRILLPKTRELVGDESVSVSIVANDGGVESMLLSGEVDIGFDCGRPVDPLVAFKRLLPEPFAVVASPKFIKKYDIKDYDDLKKQSLLKFARTENVILNLDVESTKYFGTFNDVASLREACILGYGWGILPYYVVKKELKEKKLKTVPGLKVEDERYGVWWMRERKSVQPWVNRAIKWLKNQDLT